MPLTIPTLDERSYQQILDEALARIPVHNPEWTNFNKSDPGVTLVEVFAFLTESLLYRANQIPERNRRRFLQLLGMGLSPASSARGLVTFVLSSLPASTMTLHKDVEVRAGQVPFRTEAGLDVLPIEAQAFYKKPVAPDSKVVAYYNQLYAAYREGNPPADLQLYETTPMAPRASTPLALGRQTTDSSLWIALLARPADKPFNADKLDAIREAIAGRTLSLALVPALDAAGATLRPGGVADPGGLASLSFQLPKGGSLPGNTDDRDAEYRTIATAPTPSGPVVVEITLPESPAELSLWDNLDPLEAGTRDFPPSLDGMEQADRVITWLRIKPGSPSSTSLLWVGINTVFVRQRARVQGELLPDGNGEPDQVVTLARTPVLPGSVRLRVDPLGDGHPEEWAAIDDLGVAGPEVEVPDLRQPPGQPRAIAAASQVFQLDAESGQLRFGDGLRGKRPPRGAVLRADYDASAGGAGNVGTGQINQAPSLPSAVQVHNPLPTWGGADAETVGEGEKQIPRFLQHRDRLVTAADFESLVRRTPGVSVGRVDVLPAYHPGLAPNGPGNAPGAVTVMVVPRYESGPPASGAPDPFLDAIACWLEPRRLVTTELFVRRPDFRPVWVSLGIQLTAGFAVADVRDAVVAAARQFLSPLPDPAAPEPDALALVATANQPAAAQDRGWRLAREVNRLELSAVAARVAGVQFVRDALLAGPDGNPVETVPMVGLQLPQLVGISVAVGAAVPLEQLRGTTSVTTRKVVPVPIVPVNC